jgi:hypothetical protein
MTGGWGLWVLMGIMLVWAVLEALYDRQQRKRDPYADVNDT